MRTRSLTPKSRASAAGSTWRRSGLDLAATFLSQKGGALLSAPLSALLTQRTAFHGDALLPLVNVAVTDGNLGLRDVSRAVWSTALLLGFRDRFLVTGLARLALIPVGLFVGDRSNFTDRLKRVLTLFR